MSNIILTADMIRGNQVDQVCKDLVKSGLFENASPEEGITLEFAPCAIPLFRSPRDRNIFLRLLRTQLEAHMETA